MALVTYSRTNAIVPALSKVLTESGFVDVTASPFLGSIVKAIQDALATEYGKMYDIANNVDIGRAEGEYLDRWGRFLNEPRESLTYAMDLSLTNTLVYLYPTVTARELTILGDGIPIPSGTQLSNDDSTIVFETLDDIYIRPDRDSAFCRVICATPGAIEVAPGMLSKVGLSLTEISNVMPSAAVNYMLLCENRSTITGGAEMASDDDYRFILLKKANSIGLFNEEKINSVMDVVEVVRISVQEYRGGANVYIETKNVQNADAVVQTIRTGLKQYRSLGLCVNAYPPIFKYFSGNIKLALKIEDPTNAIKQKFTSDFVNAVNATPMGSNANLESILTNVVRSSPNVQAAKFVSGSYGGRSLLRFNVPQYFNEKILTSDGRLSVS